ncbi:MAG TPA: hypothetical protein DCP63_13045 [Bacteroidetes bacterium]|nr:hypothetical protein [Bacteroidota bacterium]
MFLLILSIVLLNSLLQQETNCSGSITGRVSESNSHKPLVGVQITASGAEGSYNTATSNDGTYEMKGMKPGRYLVRALCVSYLPRMIGDIRIAADSTTRLDIAMMPTSRLLDSIVAYRRPHADPGMRFYQPDSSIDYKIKVVPPQRRQLPRPDTALPKEKGVLKKTRE